MENNESSQIKLKIDDIFNTKTETLIEKFNNDLDYVEQLKFEYNDIYHICK